MDEPMLDLMAKLKREASEGGELMELPCPFCGRPRSQRSDYIRCTPCGMNWLQGEELSKDPRIERFNKVRFPNGLPSVPASTGTPIASPAVALVVDADAQ
jgi:hypothetical protein